MKLLFTGAHHNSALVVLDWLVEHQKANSKTIDLVWIGKKYAKDGKLTPEFSEVTKRPVKFYEIKAGKLFRFTNPKYFFQFIYNLLLIPIGFLQSIFIMAKEKPDLIVSFGGFISVPIVIAAKFFRIKSITHEQTTSTGLANNINEKFVEKVFTAWPLDNYPKRTKKYEFIGLPIRSNLLQEMQKKSFKNIFMTEKSLLYVTGGKAGSTFINQIVYESINELSRQFNIIWSAGNSVGTFGYSYLKRELANNPISDSVYLKEYFGEEEVANIINSADIVISRSGAHTVYELGVLKKPCLLIPLAYTTGNEQYKNARILEKAGLAVIIDENLFNKNEFLSKIQELYKNRVAISKNANINLDLKSAENLGTYILGLLK